MSLLLLLATDPGTGGGGEFTSPRSVNPWPVDIHIGAEEPLGMRPPGMPLGLQPLRNEYVRAVEGFSITYTLMNRAVMSCRTVDPREDIPNAYRPVTNQRVKVLTKDGLATVFSGRIINVSETSMQAGARTGTTLQVDVVDDQEIFDYTWLTRAFGTESVPLLSLDAGNPTTVHTTAPHGFTTGTVVTIEGVVAAGAVVNGTRAVTVVNPTTFTIPVNLAAPVAEPGGTARGRVYLRDAIDTVLFETGLLDRGIVRDPAMDLGPLLEYYNFDTTVTEIWKAIFGAAGWVYRLLPDKTFQAFPPGSKTTTFEFNEKTCLGSPEIGKNRSGFANTVRVTYGSNAVALKLDIWSSNGVARRYPITYKPFFGADGTFPGNVGGMLPDYIPVPYSPTDTTHEWMVDLATQELVQNSAFPVVPNGTVIHFAYQVQFPQVLEVVDQDLVDEQGGKWVKRIELPDVYEANTARDQGEMELARVKVQPRKVSFVTREELVMPGTTIPVHFPVRLMTDDVAQWMVYSVSITEDKDGCFRYRYTIQEDNQFHPGWIEFFKDMARSGSTSTVPTSSTIPPTAGGLSGIGTAGHLARWASSSSLTDAANIEEITGGIKLNGFLRGNMGGAYDFALQNLGGSNVFRVPTGTANLEMVGNITTGATTNLNLVPTGSVVFNPGSKTLLPNLAYDVNIGMLSKKFLTLHAAELWVETLVAQNTIATIGGRILVGRTSSLIVDFSVGQATIVLKHNSFAVNDRLYMEADGKVEFMAVTSGPTAVTGGWSYTVTRNLDGTGENNWFAGDAIFNTGQIGSGFIDIYSVRGTKSSSEVGPTIVGNYRYDWTYNAWEPRWAIGNLNGLYGYGSNIFGVALGQRTASWLSFDTTAGIRISHNNTVFTQIDLAGNAGFTGYMTVTGGITTGGVVLNGGAISSNGFNWGVTPGFYLGYNGNYVFYIGDGTTKYIVWDGTNMQVRATVMRFGVVVMDDNGLQIPFTSSGFSARLVIGDVVIDSSSTGTLFISGGVSANAFDSVHHLYTAGYIRADGDLECYGYLKCHSAVEWTNTNLSWVGIPSTTADDYPLVHSAGNTNVYKKTNGYNGNLSLSGVTGIVVQRGIVTGTY